MNFKRPVLLSAVMLTFLALACPWVHAQAPSKAGAAMLAIPDSPADILTTLKPGHPRLLAGREDFDRIRQLVETDPLMGKWHDALLKQADALPSKPALQMSVEPGGSRIVLQGTGLLRDRMYLLGMLYQLHGKQAYVDEAWRQMQSALELPDWNERHFLGVAETTRALAIAYDWLHAGLSPQQRTAIADAIASKGLAYALRAYHGQTIHGWWPAVADNWNQVCNGGIGIGALAVADIHPDLAREALWQATRLLPIAMRSYAPDGAWDEGLAYWSYGGDYNVQFIACLQSALGTDFGLSDMPGFSQTGFYPIQLTGPTGEGFNFGDAGGVIRMASPIQLWLARRFNQPLIARPYLARQRGGVLDLLWHTPELAQRANEASYEDALPRGHRYRGPDIFTFRSNWSDPDALFIAFKGGSNQANHAHIDLGSFVLDALGQRWASDLGTDSYNLPGYFKQQRWTYYRVRTESHNTLVINPSSNVGQNLKAKAKVTTFDDGPVPSATLDLTDAYSTQPPAPRKVTRTIVRQGSKAIHLIDHITPAQAGDGVPPTRAWWFMHTRAKVELDDTGRLATLTIKDKTLHVRIHKPADVRFDTAPAGPLPTSPNPEGQARNPGVTRLSIDLAGPLVQGPVDLVVTFEPVKPEAAAEQGKAF